MYVFICVFFLLFNKRFAVFRILKGKGSYIATKEEYIKSFFLRLKMQKIIKKKHILAQLHRPFFYFFFPLFSLVIFVCIECCIGDIKVAQYLWERVYFFLSCGFSWGCVHFHILGYFVSDYGLVSDYFFFLFYLFCVTCW